MAEKTKIRPVGFGGHGGGFRGPAEKPKDFKGTVTNLWRELKPYRLSIAIVFLFAIGGTVFSIVGPKILGSATNQISSDYLRLRAYQKQISLGQTPAGGAPVFDFVKIKNILVFLGALYLISFIFNYLQSFIMSGVTQKVASKFRKDISEKINRLPLSYFDKHNYGEVLSRITNDVDTVSQTLNQSLSQIITSVVSLAGILVMMLTISPILTVIAVIMLPFSFFLIRFITRRSQVHFAGQQANLGLINGHIEEMYSGHSVMKAFGGEEQSIKKFSGINDKLYESAWKAQFFSSLLHPLMNLVGNAGYVGVAVAGGALALNGKLQIGDIQAFIQYVQQFNQPINQTANIANILQSTAAAAERVFEFLDEPEEEKDTENPVILDNPQGSVSFENVTFGYQKGKDVIKNLSAHVSPGQRVAIVGPTGAGKTTLVNLLMRFYEVEKGSIKIDGVDIRKMKKSDVRKMFGMVLQDTWLFAGSIRENISYGKPDADFSEVVEAAKEAQIDHFIRSLPGGYDMQINEEGGNISQGEKQLLTIARAMLVKTPMLILDEATSSVDTRTEVLIQKAMDSLMKGKTSFVIAHRLSTIRDADLILVVKDGNIIEQGTHESLLEANGYYASLYNSQFEASDPV